MFCESLKISEFCLRMWHCSCFVKWKRDKISTQWIVVTKLYCTWTKVWSFDVSVNMNCNTVQHCNEALFLWIERVVCIISVEVNYMTGDPCKWSWGIVFIGCHHRFKEVQSCWDVALLRNRAWIAPMETGMKGNQRAVTVLYYMKDNRGKRKGTVLLQWIGRKEITTRKKIDTENEEGGKQKTGCDENDEGTIIHCRCYWRGIFQNISRDLTL